MNRKANEENGVETLVDSDGILWLNEKHIDHKRFQVITVKYHSGCGKHRYEVLHEPEKQPTVFIQKELALKEIISCRTIAAHKFRTTLGFKQYDVVLTHH